MRGRRLTLGVLGVGLLAAGAVLVGGTAQAAGGNGAMTLANLTRPSGGAWLPGGGGHFWVSDNVLGMCETVPLPGGSPPFQTAKCNGTAKGGQAVFDSAANLVYVADTTSKTNQVVRFTYDPRADALTSPVTLQVPNVTSVGGGKSGGRAQAVALDVGPDGTQRLYVGYLKSGDVMQVLNPSGHNASGGTVTPTVSRVGTTSDGRGVAGFAVAALTDNAGVPHHDLYLAESGGTGLSVIHDIDGTAGRPACSAGAVCAAVTVTTPNGGALVALPGAVVADGAVLYIADAPLTTPSRVLRVNPVTGAQDVYSTDVSPPYTSSDGVTHAQYQNITGLAVDPGSHDLYVGDDPTFPAATPVTGQGHLWRVAAAATRPVVTAVSPASGTTAGGDRVTVTGTHLVDPVAGAGDTVAFGTRVSFGSVPATGVTCTADGTSCTATSPAVAGAGTLDVRVTNVDGQVSDTVPADQFAYKSGTVAPGAPVVTGISPQTGLTAGGTTVTVTGTGLVNPDGSSAVSFGTAAATVVSCAPDGTSCTATSPAGTAGATVDVQVTTAAGTSAAVAADRFTYRTPEGTLYSYGVTAPEGVVFIPNGKTNPDGSPAGHYWASDHANGECRLDPVPGTGIVAPNVAVCDPGFTIGSPGQAVYEPNANPDGTHYVFVPDNAVKSQGVWRLTFDPVTETVSNPVAMAPGLIAALKPNGLALSADGHDLYVGDLVDAHIRRINGVDGDPRSQTVDVVATLQPGKGNGSAGINGSMAMLGTRLFLPENNAATYVDTSAACAAKGTATPCSTTVLNLLPTPAAVFVAGVAADARHNTVYISLSPGAAPATVYRFDATTITPANPGGNPGQVYVTDGRVPAAGTPEATVYCSLTCTRPADPTLTPGGTTGFTFAAGLYVDPTTGVLFITEDTTAGARAGRGHVWQVPYTP